MKKPEQYDLKKWLCSNYIVALRIHYYQVGIDTSDTDWELYPDKGESKRMKRHTIEHLVDVDPDWVSVLRVRDSVLKEVQEYKAFAKKEATDLATYERLKKKFEQ